MIMTKDKNRTSLELNDRNLHTASELLSDGLAMLAATNDVNTVKEMAESADADSILVGLVIPVKKGAAICQLLGETTGMMDTTVLLLQSTPGSTTAPRSVGAMAHTSSLPETASPTLKIKDIVIDDERHEVRVKNKPVTLTFSEYKILQTLALKPGRVFSRDKIIHAVHGDNYSCTERAVDVQVTGLRKKLGASGAYIETVRGVGYRFRD
ncbi:MAG TPA: winged helix-turn-helix domain-containing protein [Kiritimatiellia bacterium]|nr:winged helix-turn-helix domain-containing protein [Kiritimatiellia bacterium]